MNIKKSKAVSTAMLSVIASHSLFPVLHAQSSDRSKPNILCITVEDISCYLGCYGDPVAKSPFLDSLAKKSIRFTNMHTPVGVSAPSRFALITGMYPSACGANYMRASQKNYEVVLPDNIKAYTEYLRSAGYYCTNNSKTDYQIGVTPAQWDENNSSATWKKCPDGKPFFAIFNITTTHESQIWMRAKQPLLIKPEDIDMKRFPYFPDDPVIRQDLARMYTNIALMDQEARNLVNDLKKSGLADNTIIIWFSDNGGPIPRGKRSLYITGTQVPFMVRLPDGYRSGEAEDRLCSFIDVPATILSLAGIKIPEYMHGRAFLGAQTSAPRDYVYGARDRFDEVVDRSAYVRDKRFQYVRNYITETCNYLHNEYALSMPMVLRLNQLRDEGKLNEKQMLYYKAPRPQEELYDLLNDPYELNNLASEPSFKHDFERLKKAFDEWNGSVNAVWNTKTEEEWIAGFKPNGLKKVVDNPVIENIDGKWSMSCTTPGASLVYKINYVTEKPATQLPKAGGAITSIGPGDPENNGWILYTVPVTAAKGEKVTVMACRAGYKSSEKITK